MSNERPFAVSKVSFGAGQPSHVQAKLAPTNPLNPTTRFVNGEVHHWYRLILGYPDHLVTFLFDKLGVTKSTRVLDPFCGSGTTLVECMKHGVRSVGIDANPASILASTAKTDWSIKPDYFLSRALRIRENAESALESGFDLRRDHTYWYLRKSGMLRRGWISSDPLRMAIAIKQQIDQAQLHARYRRILELCLISEVVYGASNVKFGPEIYCGPAKKFHDVFRGFETRARQISADLRIVRPGDRGRATVIQGDARVCHSLLRSYAKFGACISSPPYPTEHDYTRNTRLELVFMDAVSDLESLRGLKKSMIRSHTKGIYVGDTDAEHASEFPEVQALVKKLRKRVGEARGFVGLYPDVVDHYFGGMKRHFESLKKVLAPGARSAYVVGDQSSYQGIHIPTAQMLATVLKSLGYTQIEVLHWRGRWSTTRAQEVDENILLFRMPS